ncbi:MAG: serine hydrolase domain-containing protein [Bacteroidota bacterium]
MKQEYPFKTISLFSSLNLLEPLWSKEKNLKIVKLVIRLLFVVWLLIFPGCSSDDTGTEDMPIAENPINDDPIDTDDPLGTSLYFPSVNMDTWETVSVDTLGWNTDAEQPLFDFLEERDTKAFIILKEGRIALEAYFNGATASDSHPWYSAGKTLVAFTVGVAQEEGFLSLDDPSADYLGAGWSNLSSADERNIQIRQHLTMTTGLDYNVSNVNCTDADCFTFLNEPDTFWYYHNATYTLVQQIVAGALDDDFDTYFNSKIKNPIGMSGAWVQLGFARVYYSDARSMARFGLLNLSEGKWEDQLLLTDTVYFDEMTTTSQDMNPAYSYLWWLNGKGSYRVPASELEFSGKLIPSAPDDLIAGLGKDDQKLYVVPSEGLVIVRLGDDGGETLLGPSSFDNELWEKINALIN